MRYQGFAKCAVIAITIFLGVTGHVLVKGDGQTPPGQDQGNEHRQVVEAVRRGGIREAARIKKSYIVTDFAKAQGVYSGLQALASHSALIIIGRAERNVCRLTPDGEYITTDYEVSVQDVIKGETRGGKNVTVSLPGGRVVFEDGTSAEIRVPDFRKMENGKSYVLFLSEKKGGHGVYQTVGGPQGLFEISQESDTVRPHGRSIDIVTEKFKDKEFRSFIKEVREAAKKEPRTVGCCD